jgi:hypothetical protein
MVPVTTMEEVPVLTEEERTDLLKSLAKAESDIEAGKGTDYDPKSFEGRLLFRAGANANSRP